MTTAAATVFAAARPIALGLLLLTATPRPGAAQTVSDPVRAAKQEIEQSCLKVEYPADFAKWADLTGDGRDDVILRYDVVCDGFNNAFCGRSGCSGAVYVALADGGYAKTDLPASAEPVTWEDRPAVRVGGAVRVWDGAGFVRPTNAVKLRQREAAEPAAEAENGDLSGDQAAALQRELVSRGELLAAAEPMTGLSREILRRERLERDSQERLARRRAQLEQEAREAEARAAALAGAAQPIGEATVGAGERIETVALEPLQPETPEQPQQPEEIDAAEDPPLTEGVWAHHGDDAGVHAAEIVGEGGAGGLRLSCRPGDPTLALTFRPGDDGGQGLVRGAGVLLLADFFVGRALSESRLLAYDARENVWRDTVSSYSRLIEDMRRGSWMEVREPGRRRALAQLPLRGSSRAISDLLTVCGL